MPINVPSISTTRTVAEPVTCSALYVDRLLIDGSGRDASPPKVEIQITPIAPGTPTVYAAESWRMGTANLYAAAARVPAIGTAIGAVFAAVAAWHAYELQREADLATAQAAADSVRADAATAQAMADAVTGEAEAQLGDAVNARNAAYPARTSPTDPLWVNADAAWSAAKDALAAAQASAADVRAQQAALVAAADSRVATAKAALDDPANDPLESQS